jgi:hypothetical protein
MPTSPVWKVAVMMASGIGLANGDGDPEGDGDC